MARKLDRHVRRTPLDGPSALRISDWDEGAAPSASWENVRITYRQSRSLQEPSARPQLQLPSQPLGRAESI